MATDAGLFAAGHICLVWWSLPHQGTSIKVGFPDGHGLQKEDTVRYRGIDVGTVESVELGDDLDGVEVEVLLKPFASRLAAEGTRFWIVRPELSLTRISGLETAIGHKYIGVQPVTSGEKLKRCYAFQGLSDVPVDTLASSGIEIILRGEKSFSVGKGAPLTYRGVEVGTVLDAGLSGDASEVHVRVRILEEFRNLLTSDSKFWASSGLDFKFGFGGGFNLDTESLEKLARGGVSMITTGQGKQVAAGHVFKLHSAVDDKWLKPSDFQRSDLQLDGAIAINATWKPRWGIWEKESKCNGFAIRFKERTLAVFPSDAIGELAKNEKAKFEITGNEIDPRPFIVEGQRFVSIPLDSQTFDQVGGFDFGKQADGIPDGQKLLAIRRPIAGAACLHSELPAPAKDAESAAWKIGGFQGDREVWHGAPVVSGETAQFIGVLYFQGNEPQLIRVAGQDLGSAGE